MYSSTRFAATRAMHATPREVDDALELVELAELTYFVVDRLEGRITVVCERFAR